MDEDFIRVPFNDILAIQALTDDKDICAVFVEPIQGEGGLHTPDDDYLEKLQNICHANDWLFMLDEVQTGNGRTGKYFAYQHSDIKPDVLTTAKGLGNGFPVGACMVSGAAKDLFGAGSHGSTFGGTPFGCRIVCAVYDELTDEVMKNAMRESDFIRQSVNEHFPQIKMRGRGMMMGFALPDGTDCTHIVDMARDEFYLILNVTGGNVIRLLPALNINHDDTVILTDRLIGLLKKLLG